MNSWCHAVSVLNVNAKDAPTLAFAQFGKVQNILVPLFILLAVQLLWSYLHINLNVYHILLTKEILKCALIMQS